MASSDAQYSSGYAFPSNTDTLDREAMTSPQAELARQRSEEVMKALKSGNPGEADAAMGKADTSHGLSGWFKRMLTNTKRDKSSKKQPQQSQAPVDGSGTNLNDEVGVSGLSAGQDLSTTSMARDGGKGDGVIR